MTWSITAVAAAVRVAAVAVLLMIGFPMLLLPRRPQWDADDRIAAAGVIGVFFIVAAAHLLVPVHVFGAVGLLLVGVPTLAIVIWKRDGAHRLIQLLRMPQDKLMRTLDKFAAPPAIDEVAAALHAQAKAEEERTRAARPKRKIRINWPVLGLALVVVAVGCYIRFGQNVTRISPAPSDFVEGLMWMKWLTMPEHGLFGDYVYPRGLHAVMSAIRFLSQEKAYPAYKVGGPVLNMLWLGWIWYMVKRISGSRVGGLVAVALYLASPLWLPGEQPRLAFTLAEGFAMGFVLPAGWLAYRYLKDGDWMDAALCAFSAAIMGAANWVGLIYLAGVFIGATAAALPHRFSIKRLLILVAWVVGGTIAGLTPQVVALLLGVPIWPTTEGFGIGDARTLYTPPSAQTLTATGLLLLLALRKMRERPALLIMPAILVIFLLINYLPAIGVPLPVVALRGPGFVALAMVAGIGVLYGWIEEATGLHKQQVTACLVGLAVVAALFVSTPPKPAQMEPVLTDEYTTQVLQLVNNELPASFRVISRPETLALVLGSGFQTDANVWLDAFPVPDKDKTIAKVLADTAKPPGLPENTPNLFFFVEKEPYLDTFTRTEGKEQERIDSNRGLQQWVAEYEATHPKAVETYYQSPTMTIYLIRPPKKG